MASVSEHVSHVVENGKAHIVLDKGQSGWGKAQLKIIQKQSRPASRKAGDVIAGAGLIQTETTMRASSPHEEPFWQGNQRAICRRGLMRLDDHSVRKRILHAHSRRAGKPKLLGGFAT